MPIKKYPEDFKVTEITNIKPQDKGDYAYFWLTKRNYNTIDAVKKVADAIHVKKIGYAGSKDRKAITKQLCSVFKTKKERIDELKFKDIELEFYGYGDKPISLGDLAGNEFEIIVRDEKINKIPKIQIINYYDEQRFSKSNVEVGKAAIKKDFKQVVELLLKENTSYNVQEYIKNNKNDYVGALKLIPKKLLSLFIHSFQSYLWNECAAEYVKNNSKVEKEIKYSLGHFVFGNIGNIKIPLISFDTEFDNNELEQIYSSLLHKEKLSMRDFIIRQLPEVNPVTQDRDLVIETNVEYKSLDEKSLLLKFTLPKGSYATMVVKYLSIP